MRMCMHMHIYRQYKGISETEASHPVTFWPVGAGSRVSRLHFCYIG